MAYGQHAPSCDALIKQSLPLWPDLGCLWYADIANKLVLTLV